MGEGMPEVLNWRYAQTLAQQTQNDMEYSLHPPLNSRNRKHLDKHTYICRTDHTFSMKLQECAKLILTHQE